MPEPLKCEKMIRILDPARDNQGRCVWYHKRCDEPAAEYEFGGLLTSAKAVLCEFHKRAADRQSFISKNGYQYGHVERKAVAKGYKQERLPGTGVTE